MEYFEKPKTGKGRKAWERYEKENGQPPASVSYSPNYQYQYKGWICEWFSQGDIRRWIGYGAAYKHTFYCSSEL